MFVPPKYVTKKNIPAVAGHFLKAEIDLTDFEKENLTTKTRTKEAEKLYFFLKNIFKDLETDKTIEKNKYLKNIEQRNIPNKVGKNC